jgi:hypothetical protein
MFSVTFYSYSKKASLLSVRGHDSVLHDAMPLIQRHYDVLEGGTGEGKKGKGR